MSFRPVRTFLFLIAAGLTVNCSWDVAQFVAHPSIDRRMKDNLALTPPAPPEVNPDSFQFALFGDPQIHEDLRSPFAAFRQEVMSRGIDFFGVVGDLTHDAAPAEQEKLKSDMDSVGIPYYVTVGNHDLYQANGWQWFKDNFGPSAYAVVIADRLKLLFLDTADGRLGEVQFDWLEHQLAADSLPTIIGTHFPAYDGTEPMMWRLASAEERYKFLSLLKRGNVYAYVAGHIHGWRHTVIDGCNHFICAMPADGLMDYGEPGYLLFTWVRGKLSWEHITVPG